MRLPIYLAEYFDWRRRFDDKIATTSAVGLAVARRLDDRSNEATTLTTLGLALREVRRFDEAIAALQDVVVIYRETGDRHGEGNALNNLGLALREVRRFDEAIAARQDAAAIFRETGDSYGESVALRNLERDQDEQRGERA